MFATDGRGAASDPAFRDVTVANTAPTAGSVTVKPSAPSTNDVLKAVPSGYADLDGDQLTYRYQWLRNGTPIAGATSATLNLALPGNGDLNDRIDVDVSAVDAGGGDQPDRARRPERDRHERHPGRGLGGSGAARPEDEPDAHGHAQRLQRP